jgi:FMN phosphatase YigB (HAD superfamily)
VREVKNKVLVFDLDDTLIDNVHDYAKPILDSAWLIIRALGSRAPHVSQIIALEQEIDLRRRSETNPETGKPYGYSMERFPSSLVRTYEEICEKSGIPVDLSVSREIHAVGMQAFDIEQYKRNIKPMAMWAVGELSHRGFIPMLLSAGDKRVQSNKLAAIKAADFFWGGIHVVDRKTPDVFRDLSRKRDGYQFWSVGNNYESDIVPALEAGYRGVWIPVETWEVIGRMDEIRAKVDHSRCIELANIAELVAKEGEL